MHSNEGAAYPVLFGRLAVGRGTEDGRGVDAGGVFAVPVVAAAVEDDGGDAGPGDEVEHVFVPGGEIAVVKPHLAEAVILMRISPFDSSGFLAEPVFSSGHRESG